MTVSLSGRSGLSWSRTLYMSSLLPFRLLKQPVCTRGRETLFVLALISVKWKCQGTLEESGKNAHNISEIKKRHQHKNQLNTSSAGFLFKPTIIWPFSYGIV